jgi:hypothetical protein
MGNFKPAYRQDPLPPPQAVQPVMSMPVRRLKFEICDELFPTNFHPPEIFERPAEEVQQDPCFTKRDLPYIRRAGTVPILEMCKSDPIAFAWISEQKYTFRIGLIKLIRSRIGLRYSK